LSEKIKITEARLFYIKIPVEHGELGTRAPPIGVGDPLPPYVAAHRGFLHHSSRFVRTMSTGCCASRRDRKLVPVGPPAKDSARAGF
jgi:hypothetical protein